MLRLIKGLPPVGQRSADEVARETDDLAPLMLRCRQGEHGAIKTLVITLGPMMLQTVRRVLGAKDPEVDDVFQEATIGLVKALPGFRAECSTRHFGYRIATLAALKARRHRRRDRELSLDDTDDGPAPPGVPQQDWALAAHRREVLRRLVDELPESQAEALVLHCVVGLTIDELAAVARSPVETARSRLRLAKAALRERITLDPSLSDLWEDSP
jgi:RNA polymerase sigma factor (sigma-70 family)